MFVLVRASISSQHKIYHIKNPLKILDRIMANIDHTNAAINRNWTTLTSQGLLLIRHGH